MINRNVFFQFVTRLYWICLLRDCVTSVSSFLCTGLFYCSVIVDTAIIKHVHSVIKAFFVDSLTWCKLN